MLHLHNYSNLYYFSGVSDKFAYVSGKTYEYQFDSTTHVRVGTSAPLTSVVQKATVTISVRSSCEFLLQVYGRIMAEGYGSVWTIEGLLKERERLL